MTDPSSILPLTATSINPFDTHDSTKASVETERKQRSLIRTARPSVGSSPVGRMDEALG